MVLRTQRGVGAAATPLALCWPVTAALCSSRLRSRHAPPPAFPASAAESVRAQVEVVNACLALEQYEEAAELLHKVGGSCQFRGLAPCQPNTLGALLRTTRHSSDITRCAALRASAAPACRSPAAATSYSWRAALGTSCCASIQLNPSRLSSCSVFHTKTPHEFLSGPVDCKSCEVKRTHSVPYCVCLHSHCR